MIVGPVLPRPCADKQKITGLTALPVPTSRGSSDPMFPKPLYARTPDRFAVKGEVYHSTISAHIA